MFCRCSYVDVPPFISWTNTERNVIIQIEQRSTVIPTLFLLADQHSHKFCLLVTRNSCPTISIFNLEIMHIFVNIFSLMWITLILTVLRSAGCCAHILSIIKAVWTEGKVKWAEWSLNLALWHYAENNYKLLHDKNVKG